MADRYRAILPASSNSPNSPGQLIDPPSEKRKRRRGNDRVACQRCRTKKKACDGNRPACALCSERGFQCKYDDVPASTPLQQARLLKQKLEKYIELVECLQNSPESLATTVLRRLRETRDPSLVLSWVNESQEDGGPLPEYQAPRNRSPPTQSSLEFELMIRHPISYPTLEPLDARTLDLEGILGRRRHGRNAGSSKPTPSTDGTPAIETDGTTTPPSTHRGPESSASGKHPHSESQNITTPPRHVSSLRDIPQTTGPSLRAPRIYDERLQRVDISRWTNVPVPNKLATEAISVYLETDHHILGFFDADLFVSDLLTFETRFCSPLLVSSLLFWACQEYTTLDPRVQQSSKAFFEEAQRLLQEEKVHSSLAAISAMQLLSLGCSSQGNDAIGLTFMREGRRMAEAMGLFGPPDTVLHRPEVIATPGDWLRATSHTAWGMFNWLSVHWLHYQDGLMESPPILPIPENNEDGNSGASGTGVTIHAVSPTVSLTFTNLCRFWAIVHDLVSKYNDSTNIPIFDRIPIELAEETFQRLLVWADSLPLSMARGDQSPDHVAVFHIWYHAAVIALFRPFTHGTHKFLMKSFASSDSTPEAVIAASTNQLKRLILVYRSKYPSASYSLLWHTALLYVANAMLVDTSDPEWRFYFLLCIQAYQKLLPTYRVAEVLVRGLLSMSMRNGALMSTKAQNILDEFLSARPPDASLEPFTSTCMVDLDLAVTNRDAAQVDVLADSFEELASFDEFTTAGEYFPQLFNDAIDEL